jgi:hypothetical protein
LAHLLSGRVLPEDTYVTIGERHARYYTTPGEGNAEILNIYGMMRVIAKVGCVSFADMQLDNPAKQKDNKRKRNRKKKCKWNHDSYTYM